jgi:hypothetical protein
MRAELGETFFPSQDREGILPLLSRRAIQAHIEIALSVGLAGLTGEGHVSIGICRSPLGGKRFLVRGVV